MDDGNNKKFGEKAVNIHNSFLRLAPGLKVAGYGGAPCATQNGEKLWSGYPSNDDKELEKGLQKLLLEEKCHEIKFVDGSISIHAPSEKKESVLEKGECLILLTHCGPKGSSTSLYPKVGETAIESGSESLAKILSLPKFQNSVLLNIHGHTHVGMGLEKQGLVHVLNVGPLKYGRYGILTLSKSPELVETLYPLSWCIKSIEFLSI